MAAPGQSLQSMTDLLEKVLSATLNEKWLHKYRVTFIYLGGASCFQCFNAVGWASRPVKMSDEVLVWLCYAVSVLGTTSYLRTIGHIEARRYRCSE